MDASASVPLPETTGLTARRQNLDVILEWDPGSRPGAVHDVVRGDLPDGGPRAPAFAGGACVRSGVTAPVLQLPVPGDAWFLVRSRLASGDCPGTWGAPPLDAARPCP